MARVGPTKGARIMVKLPFGKDKEKPATGLILIKSEVAKALKFKPVAKIPEKKVKMKTVAGERTYTRAIKGSYKHASVKLLFAKPKTIGGKQYKSVSIPMASSTNLNDFINFFAEGEGKTLGVAGLVSRDGAKTQWAEIAVTRR